MMIRTHRERGGEGVEKARSYLKINYDSRYIFVDVFPYFKL